MFKISTRRKFELEPLPSMTPTPSSEQKYARPPLRWEKHKYEKARIALFREFSSPPREFSLSPKKFSLPPKEFSPPPNRFNKFSSEQEETFDPTPPSPPTSRFINQNNVNFGKISLTRIPHFDIYHCACVG